ncbi:MAG: hypothetical protein AABZ61_14620, partial [Bacteroidota bacterium]
MKQTLASLHRYLVSHLIGRTYRYPGGGRCIIALLLMIFLSWLSSYGQLNPSKNPGYENITEESLQATL